MEWQWNEVDDDIEVFSSCSVGENSNEGKERGFMRAFTRDFV